MPPPPSPYTAAEAHTNLHILKEKQRSTRECSLQQRLRGGSPPSSHLLRSTNIFLDPKFPTRGTRRARRQVGNVACRLLQLQERLFTSGICLPAPVCMCGGEGGGEMRVCVRFERVLISTLLRCDFFFFSVHSRVRCYSRSSEITVLYVFRYLQLFMVSAYFRLFMFYITFSVYSQYSFLVFVY